jgi:sigma-E factor negative regulatory protein RseB
VIGALIALLVVAPAASADPAPNVLTADDPEAVALLQKASIAPSSVSYSGTQYVSAWSAMPSASSARSAVVELRHEAGGATEVRARDERPVAVLPGRADTTWLADGADPDDLLADAYALRLGSPGQVAGRTADVVEARRADGSLAARLWLDRETALTLRRETFATSGALLTATAFVEVSITPDPLCCGLRAVADHRDVPSDRLDAAQVETLRAEGWACPGELPGGFVLYEARRLDDDALHLSYSDGVMTVSVFQQAGRLDPDGLDGFSEVDAGEGVTVYANPGPPARFTWSAKDHVVTVLADAPLQVIRDLVSEIPPADRPEREPVADDFLVRLGRGVERAVAWMNPFD